jgi:hypothetical protein
MGNPAILLREAAGEGRMRKAEWQSRATRVGGGHDAVG